MGTEIALANTSVILARERHTPSLKVLNAAASVLRHNLGRMGIGEKITLLDRVRRVLLPAVLGIHRG